MKKLMTIVLIAVCYLGGLNVSAGAQALKKVKMTIPVVAHSMIPIFLAQNKGFFADEKLDVDVTIGVQRPEQVDLEKIKTSLPLGNVTVKAVKGGLDVADPEANDRAVIASAAIAVRIETA